VLPLLRKAAPSRVINVASRAHQRAPAAGINFDDLHFIQQPYGMGEAAYAQSKLANMLHARKLAQLYGKDGITAVSLHPGVVNNGQCSTPDGLHACWYTSAAMQLCPSANTSAHNTHSCHRLLSPLPPLDTRPPVCLLAQICGVTSRAQRFDPT